MRLFKSGLVVVALAGTSVAQPRPMPQQEPVTPQQEPATPQAEETAECPEFLRDVDLSIKDVKSGVTFQFTTPRKENVKELRELLTDAADVIEEHSNMSDQQRAMTDPAAPEIPPLDISVKNVNSGARVTIRAERSQDIEPLREQARNFEEFWDSSECVQGPTATMPSVEPETSA